MAKAVKASHFPIPTPQELRHNFAGAVVFSKLDMTHAFYQFLMDEETRKHYTFYTPWGLYCFNTMVMGVSSASGETHTVKIFLDRHPVLNRTDADYPFLNWMLVHGRSTICEKDNQP